MSENLDELSEALLLSIPKVIKISIEKAPKERNNIAAILNRFGNWIQEFSLGQYDINIELAITAYKQALHIRTRDSHPLAWAQSMSDLSIALCVRIRGERSEILKMQSPLSTCLSKLEIEKTCANEWAQCAKCFSTSLCV